MKFIIAIPIALFVLLAVSTVHAQVMQQDGSPVLKPLKWEGTRRGRWHSERNGKWAGKWHGTWTGRRFKTLEMDQETWADNKTESSAPIPTEATAPTIDADVPVPAPAPVPYAEN